MTSAAPAVRGARGLTVRARLALWHAALFGALLLLLAAAGLAYTESALRAQVDVELTETTRLLASTLATRPAGTHGEALRELRAGHLDLLLVDPAAKRLVAAEPRRIGAQDSSVWPTLVAVALARTPVAPHAPFTVRLPDERRVATAPIDERDGRGLTLVVVRDLDDVRAVTARLRRTVALAVPVALLLAVLFGWVLAWRSLAPVLAMSEHAARLGAASLGTGGERFHPRHPDDELGRLAQVFNALLDRLAGTLEQQRRFMADASHELRTPSAVVRSAADVALRRPDRTAAEYRQALEIARDESDRLAHLVDDLFLLAHADTGQPTLRLADYYLDETLGECVRALDAVADARGITLAQEPAAEAPCRGDEALVRRLVLNLVENALRFTPRGGRVTLRLAPEPRDGRPGYRIEVADTGVGVPAALRTRIFDRFFHTEAHAPARTDDRSSRGGAGLGLAMGRAIAEAHGGTLTLAPAEGAGSRFVAWLPQDDGEGRSSGV